LNKFELLFEEIGAQIGMESLSFGDDNTCSLEFDDNVVLTFVVADTVLYCVAYLGDWNDEPAIAKKLLEANFAWQATNGGTLAIEPGSSRVVLSRSWEGDGLTMQAMMSNIEDMVSAAETCKEMLEGATEAQTATPSMSHDDPYASV